MIEVARFILGLAAFLCIASFAGQADLEEADRQANEYCENVKTGVWPDFRATYKNDCAISEK